VVLVGAAGCKAGGCAANTLGDVVGQTGDAYCDRRFVAVGREGAPFCQEIVDTVATGQFEDDCRDKHAAQAGEGTCPRERRIAGCKLHKQNDDGSEVWDWFYDTSNLDDAGRSRFADPVTSKEEVKSLCADKARYEEGATYQDP
jgi:hypothetical protein